MSSLISLNKKEKRVIYSGNGTEVRIKTKFEPMVIRIVSDEGNEFLWTSNANKTWLFRDSVWSSTISKYEITDGGISLDYDNGEVVIGDNEYINEADHSYMIMIFGEEGGE